MEVLPVQVFVKYTVTLPPPSAPVMKGRIPLYVMNLWCAYGKSDGHSQIVIGMPVIVAMANAQRYTQMFFLCPR